MRQSSNRLISIFESLSVSCIGAFTIGSRGTTPGGGDGDIIIDKDYTHCVYADGDDVKAVSVGIVGQ